jgi:DNA polymerase III delta prime subunit
VEDARADQGQASSNDLDKMLLYAWHEHRLRLAVRKARELVEDEAARVRSQRQPALIPLYRAAAGLSRALGDELPAEFAHELRALAREIDERAEAERIDAVGAARAVLRRLADKLDGLQRGADPEDAGPPEPPASAPA